MKPFFLWIAGCLSVSTLMNVNAALSISYSANQPATNLVITHTPAAGTATYELRYIPSSEAATQWRRDIGQTFLAETNFSITAFSLKLGGAVASTAAGQSMTVRIFERDTNPAGTLNTAPFLGTEIYSDTANWLTAGSIDGWAVFDVGSVALTAGKYYTFFINFDTQASGMSQLFRSEQNGTYTDGQAKVAVDANAVNSNRFTDISTARDFVFVVQGAIFMPTVKLYIIN